MALVDVLSIESDIPAVQDALERTLTTLGEAAMEFAGLALRDACRIREVATEGGPVVSTYYDFTQYQRHVQLARDCAYATFGIASMTAAASETGDETIDTAYRDFTESRIHVESAIALVDRAEAAYAHAAKAIPPNATRISKYNHEIYEKKTA